MSNIFKPHRGKKSTMLDSKKTLVLQSGELFLEYPNGGLGSGTCNIKVGNGSSQYKDLAYINTEIKSNINDHGVYYKLGTATIPQQGYYFELNARIGNGYNAGGYNQDAAFIIRFRTSNSNSSVTKNSTSVYADGWVEYFTNYTYDILVNAVSSTEYEFWIGKLNYTGASFYTVCYTDGVKFDPTTSRSESAPTYTYTLDKYINQYTSTAVDCGDEG